MVMGTSEHKDLRFIFIVLYRSGLNLNLDFFIVFVRWQKTLDMCSFTETIDGNRTVSLLRQSGAKHLAGT